MTGQNNGSLPRTMVSREPSVLSSTNLRNNARTHHLDCHQNRCRNDSRHGSCSNSSQRRLLPRLFSCQNDGVEILNAQMTIVNEKWGDRKRESASSNEKTRMNDRTKLTLATVGLVGVGTALILRSRATKRQRETEGMVTTLRQAATANAETVSFKDFDRLPVPVAAYFRFALKEGQARIRTAKIHHEGEFHLNDKWIPFDSTQDFSAHPAGFVWDATMKMNPFLNVSVRDSYLMGRGAMSAQILSFVTMMDAHDDARLDAGSLMRYLAELAWLPTALLPSANLKWTAIDDRRALATLSDGATTVALEFGFNPNGEISDFFAPSRIYSLEGESKAFPWAGRLWNYHERNGMRIPLEGEVSWRMPHGSEPYYRGKIVDIQYD